MLCFHNLARSEEQCGQDAGQMWIVCKTIAQVGGIHCGSVVAGESYVGTGLFILADVVLLIVVLIRRRQLEPEPAPA